MTVSLNVIPLGGEAGSAARVSERLKDRLRLSSLPHKFTPVGILLSGDWAEIVPIVRQCQKTAKEVAPYVVTVLAVEDEVSDGPARAARWMSQRSAWN